MYYHRTCQLTLRPVASSHRRVVASSIASSCRRVVVSSSRHRRVVAPALLDLLLPSNGEVEAAFLLPNDPALVSVSFSSQVVGLDLSAGGALVQMTSTNALLLTVGAL